MKGQSKTSEPKIRFNEAEKAHIAHEANQSARTYFDSFHDAVKDLPKNISEKVTNDITEVINPVIKMTLDTKKRIDRLEIIMAGALSVIAIVLFVLAITKEPRSRHISSAGSYTESTLKGAQ